MDQCMKALQGILGDLAANPAAEGLDRSLSCRLTDLDEVVVGRLSSGAVRDLHVGPHGPAVAEADIRLRMTSDDLVALTDGRLSFGPAWATGRVKLEAGFRDLLRLRKLLFRSAGQSPAGERPGGGVVPGGEFGHRAVVGMSRPVSDAQRPQPVETVVVGLVSPG